jgi:hypothetical protein
MLEEIGFSRSHFNLETRNFEISLPSRDKSRKTVLEMQNLDIVNLGSKKLGLSRDRIRRLEILDLDNKIYSRDFIISRFIFNLEAFCIFKISF